MERPTRQIDATTKAEPPKAAKAQVVVVGPHEAQTKQIVVPTIAEPERARWQVAGVGPRDS